MLFNKDIDAVVLANGDYPTAPRPVEILEHSPFTVCCDGGADGYIARGRTPDLIIGDGDSLCAENRAKFHSIIIRDTDQQTNDQTKAVKHLLSLGKRRIAIVGATGKRDDHTLGNIALLTEYMRHGAEVRSYTDYGVFIPCRGRHSFNCKAGAQVSVFNMGATGFSSQDLSYPLYDFTALWQGTLNEAPEGNFTIEAQGDYIVYITYESKY